MPTTSIRFLIILFLVNIFFPAKAQIIPDHTLPFSSTILQDGNSILIEGGSEAGTNLFHSFQEFSVNNGQTVLFNNGSNIQNISSCKFFVDERVRYSSRYYIANY
jgi:large exoprotein involved in heme utilization and adhesion